MELLTGNIKQLYRKYLTASVGSAMVMSIYSAVDTIAVGQAEGSVGAAAMAVVMPLYGVLIFFAVLCGVGGSVLMSNARGEGHEENGNAYFTASLLLMGMIAVVLWVVFILFHKQFFVFFGATDEIMPKVMEYGLWIIWSFPVFIGSTFISAFIRNDSAPRLAMAAVIIGGCVNIFGDWFFVFPLGMGMAGAAMATVLGTIVQLTILCSHFFTKRCRLRLVKPYEIGKAFRKILGIGFGAGVLDLGTVILAIIMNNQIMRYGDTTALAVYGVLAAIVSLLQSIYSGVGQAIQPIVSANCGAKQTDRIRRTWNMSLLTVVVMGIVFTALGELFPEQIVRLFMDVTPEVLAAAPGIVRPYFLVFLFMGITVLSTYHLQSTMHGKMSMVVAILRSAVLSGALMFMLPLFLDILGVWLAMPISELIVAVIALAYIKTCNSHQI